MNRPQLTEAVKLALSDEDLSGESIDCFDGFGLPDFKPVFCSIRQVARLIRWQALPIMTKKGQTPEVDNEALDAIAYAGRHKFTIV